MSAITRRLQQMQHAAEAAGRVDPLMRTPRQLKAIWSYISGAAPLQDLTEAQQLNICRSIAMTKTTKNQLVVKEGSLGGSFYVVLAGAYSVWQLDKMDGPPMEEYVPCHCCTTTSTTAEPATSEQ